MKVSVVSAGYDTIIKTQLVIHVGEKMLRVICKDGRVLVFSYEPQELRDFILCQISQHQVAEKNICINHISLEFLYCVFLNVR